MLKNTKRAISIICAEIFQDYYSQRGQVCLIGKIIVGKDEVLEKIF